MGGYLRCTHLEFESPGPTILILCPSTFNDLIGDLSNRFPRLDK